MDASFWKDRWQDGRIAFHEGRPNRYLVRHLDRLGAATRVLVPMCGKAEDLAFLAARGHEVVGVELVEDAVRAFFAEHGAEPAVTPRGSLVEYDASPIRIFAGDFFALTGEALLGSIGAIYDRAALVALPEASRRRYVEHLRGLAERGTRVLVVTFEYDQALMSGPPFSVPEAELRALYAPCEVELLSEGPDPRFIGKEDAPVSRERCFAITL